MKFNAMLSFYRPQLRIPAVGGDLELRAGICVPPPAADSPTQAARSIFSESVMGLGWGYVWNGRGYDWKGPGL